MRIGLVLSAAILLGCDSEPPPKVAVDPPPTEEIACLAEAPFFAASCIGITGAMPRMVPCWRVIAAHSEAPEYFMDLLDHATVAGQLYALAGLSFTVPWRYLMEVERYEASPESVWVMEGCIVRRVRVPDVIADFQERAIALRLLSMECP